MVLLRLVTGAFVATSAAAYGQSSLSPANTTAGTIMNCQSAFSDYRSFAEIEIASPKRGNSDAASLDGHMGQMMRDATPAMTMVFQVSDPALLDSVKVGDKVKFKGERIGGAFVVVDVQPAR